MTINSSVVNTQAGKPPPLGRCFFTDDWLKQIPEEPDSIIKDALDRGDKLCIIGGSKRKKSFLALQLALSISSGIDFLEMKIAKPRRVLLIQFELQQQHYHKRHNAVAQKLQSEFAEVGETVVSNNLLIVNARGLEMTPRDILNWTLWHKAEVLVIDPLYVLIAGDENSAQDLKPLLKSFSQIAEKAGVAIIYTHHDPKGLSGKRDIRDRGSGSSVLARDYDSCWTLTEHEGDPNSSVVDFLFRNYPEKDSTTITWKHGMFYSSNLPPVPKTTFKRKDNSVDKFIPDAVKLIGPDGIEKKLFGEKLEGQFNLSRERATKLYDSMIKQNLIKKISGNRRQGQPDLVVLASET